MAQRPVQLDKRGVYGPGAGVMPEVLLDRGIDAVAGLLVTRADALVERQLAGEKWGDAREKVVFSRRSRRASGRRGRGAGALPRRGSRR